MGAHFMRNELKDLLEKAKHVPMTQDEREAQRRSFAYGNTKIENDLITRQTIDAEAEALPKRGGPEK
jgi:hypothetical protein